MSPYYPPQGGGSSNSGGLAGTGFYYIVGSSTPGLPISKIITAGSSVTTHTDSTFFYINATTSGGSSLQPTVPGNIPLSSVVYVASNTTGLVTGTYDLYTVPTGKRAMFLSSVFFNNATTSFTMGAQLLVKTNGLYYAFEAVNTANPGGNTAIQLSNFIAEGGEIFSCYLSGVASTASAYLKVVEFDTSVNVRSARIYNPASGNTTVFTSANSSTAIILPNTGILNANNGHLLFYNAASGAVITKWYLVASGASVNDKYLITASSSIASQTKSALATANFSLNSGQYISFFCGSAAAPQLVWINFMEL